MSERQIPICRIERKENVLDSVLCKGSKKYLFYNTFRHMIQSATKNKNMVSYKNQIKNATSVFELSCIWEEVRNAFYNKKSISFEAKERRSKEIEEKSKELRERE